MNNLFTDELGVYVHVYIDDIFIFSETYKAHLVHVRTMLQRLKDHKFYASKDKSQFLPDGLYVLEHVIIKRGISPLPQKVTKLQHWPYPQKR